MALDLALDAHDTGLVARYWKITSTQLDHMRGSVTLWLHGWANDAARLAGRTPASSITVTLDRADIPSQDLHAVTTATLYTALKAKAEAAATEAEDGFEHAAALLTHGAAHLAGAMDC